MNHQSEPGPTNTDSTLVSLFNPITVHNAFLHLCTHILESFINIKSLIKAGWELLGLLRDTGATSFVSLHLLSTVA